MSSGFELKELIARGRKTLDSRQNHSGMTGKATTLGSTLYKRPTMKPV